MNRENVKQVRDLIAGINPVSFNMGTWRGANECGTVACIGGWCNVLQGSEVVGVGQASEFLGLDFNTGHDLFHPHDVKKSWNTVTPAEAVRVLDHLLATGTVDWTIIN